MEKESAQVSLTKRLFSFGNCGKVRLDRNKLTAIAKAKKPPHQQILLKILCYRFTNEFFSFGDCVQKNPKPSVKLAQSGSDLVQSVKLGV